MLPWSYHEIKEKTKKREHKVATGEAEDMGSLHPQRTVGRSGSGEHKCPDNLQDAAFCLKQYFWYILAFHCGNMHNKNCPS